jgi:hypothetical protein
MVHWTISLASGELLLTPRTCSSAALTRADRASQHQISTEA